MLKNTYRTDKDRIAALLPPGIEPGDDPHVNVTIYNTPGTRNGVSVPPSEAWLSYWLVSVVRETRPILPIPFVAGLIATFGEETGQPHDHDRQH